MAKEITTEKERERESPLPLEKSVIQSEIEFDRNVKKNLSKKRSP